MPGDEPRTADDRGLGKLAVGLWCVLGAAVACSMVGVAVVIRTGGPDAMGAGLAFAMFLSPLGFLTFIGLLFTASLTTGVVPPWLRITAIVLAVAILVAMAAVMRTWPSCLVPFLVGIPCALLVVAVRQRVDRADAREP